jgi:hypothetical protein
MVRNVLLQTRARLTAFRREKPEMENQYKKLQPKNNILTKAAEFSPVLCAPVVIQNSTPRKGSILSRPYSHGARLCPTALDHLPTHPSSALGKVDVIVELTTFPVTREVKLWHDNSPIREGAELEGG